MLVYVFDFVSFQPSAQQQVEPKPASSFPLTEVAKIPTSAASAAGKSQPPLGSREVPEKNKSLSPASELTAIEVTKPVPTPSTFATAASEGLAVPTVAKSVSGAVLTVDMSKQKLPQMSNPADAPKPPLQMSPET